MPIYQFYVFVLCFKRGPHLLQLFSRMLQRCFTVKLQKCFVDCKTSPDWIFIFEGTFPLSERFQQYKQCVKCDTSFKIKIYSIGISSRTLVNPSHEAQTQLDTGHRSWEHCADGTWGTYSTWKTTFKENNTQQQRLSAAHPPLPHRHTTLKSQMSEPPTTAWTHPSGTLLSVTDYTLWLQTLVKFFGSTVSDRGQANKAIWLQLPISREFHARLSPCG